MGEEIYIGGRLGNSIREIDAFSKELEERRHRVIEKWWLKGRLVKPYLQHMEVSRPASVAMINAAYNSRISIMFNAEDILGAAIELGAAIASTKVNPSKEVIVVHPPEARQSVFFAHPAVIVVEGIAQIRDMHWY